MYGLRQNGCFAEYTMVHKEIVLKSTKFLVSIILISLYHSNVENRKDLESFQRCHCV